MVGLILTLLTYYISRACASSGQIEVGEVQVLACAAKKTPLMEVLTCTVLQISIFVFLQILVIIGLTHALVVFRVIAAVLLAEGSWEFLSNHSNSGAMMLGAVLHYLIITVMTRVHRSLNVYLCFLLEIPSVTLTCLCLCRSTGL